MKEKQAGSDWTGSRGERAARLFMNSWRGRLEDLVLGGGKSSVLKAIAGSLAGDAVVLDVGCGSGYLSIPIAGMLNAGTVVCLDLSEEMLKALKANAAEAGLSGRIRIVRAPAGTSGLDDASVDLVVSNNVVHEFPDLREVVAEWVRILRPGGRVVFNDFRATRPVKLFMSGHHHDVHGPYREDELESLLLEAGLRGVRVTPRRHTLLATATRA
jgi:ubiquinone/menaquinone biosynthesis C-methylase UbiE